jgi:16S rRNA (uracil1498-N3)-methyltransferase
LGFLVRILQDQEDEILSKENRHRLERVMRLRPGDAFTVTDGSGYEASATLGDSGCYTTKAWVEPQREPDIDVTLFAAVTKGEKFDWLVEKTVELGVRRIIPFFSQHSVVKKVSTNRQERWQKIALSAMLQCGGCILPEVAVPLNLNKLPKPAPEHASIVLFEHPATQKVFYFADLPATRQCWLLSGPEGGFSQQEIDLLGSNGWQIAWLGPRIFRAETAPLIALSNIFSGHWGKQ